MGMALGSWAFPLAVISVLCSFGLSFLTSASVRSVIWPWVFIFWNLIFWSMTRMMSLSPWAGLYKEFHNPISLKWLSICTSQSSDLIDISDLGHGELILRLLGLWYCGILLSSGTGWSLAVVWTCCRLSSQSFLAFSFKQFALFFIVIHILSGLWNHVC